MSHQKIKLDPSDRKQLATSMKKIIGQMNSVLAIIESNQVDDGTFNQLLATKGGVTRVCKEIIARGVIPNLKNYTDKQIDHALTIIFRLEK